MPIFAKSPRQFDLDPFFYFFHGVGGCNSVFSKAYYLCGFTIRFSLPESVAPLCPGCEPRAGLVLDAVKAADQRFAAAVQYDQLDRITRRPFAGCEQNRCVRRGHTMESRGDKGDWQVVGLPKCIDPLR